MTCSREVDTGWMSGRLFCSLCGDVIGVYEPLLVVGGGAVRTSSVAREPLVGSGEDVVIHRACGLDLGISGPDHAGSSSAERCSNDG
jgi:hypothetical protein